MLDFLGIENFKIFDHYQRLDLKDITVLTGTNSSGKSSFNQALKLLQVTTSSFESSVKSINTLNFDDTHSPLGDYLKVVSNNDKSKSIKFNLPINWLVRGRFDLTLVYKLDSASTFNEGILHSIAILDKGETIFSKVRRDQEVIDNHKMEDDELFGVDTVATSEYDIFFDYLMLSDVFFSVCQKCKEAMINYCDLKEKLSLKEQFLVFKNIEDENFVNGLNDDLRSCLLSLKKYKNYINVQISYKEDLNKYKTERVEFGTSNILRYYNGDLKKINENIDFDNYDASKLLFEYRGFDFTHHEIEKLRKIETMRFLSFPRTKFGFTTEEDRANTSEVTFGSGVTTLEKGKHGFDIDRTEITKGTNYHLFHWALIQIESAVKAAFNNINFEYIPSVRNFSNGLLGVNQKSYAEQSISKLYRYKPNKIRLAFFEEWLIKFEIAQSIEVVSVGNTGGYELLLVNGNEKESLSSVGYGYGQILPILMQLSLGKRKKYVIEEPETNLHPALQSKLAEFFIATQITFKYQLIIETHSEYLIRKMQYLIATKKYKSEDLALYYFYKPVDVPLGEKQVKTIGVAENGLLLDDFGNGFIDEADSIAMNLYHLTKGQTN